MKSILPEIIYICVILILCSTIVSASDYAYNPKILGMSFTQNTYGNDLYNLNIIITGFGMMNDHTYGSTGFMILIDNTAVLENEGPSSESDWPQDQLSVSVLNNADLKGILTPGEHSLDILSNGLIVENDTIVPTAKAEGTKSINKTDGIRAIPEREIVGTDAMIVGSHTDFVYDGENFSFVGANTIVRKPYIDVSFWQTKENEFFDFNVVGLEPEKNFEIKINNENKGTFESSAKGKLYAVLMMPALLNHDNVLSVYQEGHLISQILIPQNNFKKKNSPSILVAPRESIINNNVTVYLSGFNPNDKVDLELAYGDIMTIYKQQITVDKYGAAEVDNIQLERPSFYEIVSFIYNFLGIHKLQMSNSDINTATQEIASYDEVYVTGSHKIGEYNDGITTTISIIPKDT